MEALSENRWEEPGNPIPLCELPCSVESVERALDLRFEKYQEEGLGPCFSAYVLAGESAAMLQGFGSRQSDAPGVLVRMRSTERDPEGLLRSVLDAFDLSPEQLRWMNRELLGEDPNRETSGDR